MGRGLHYSTWRRYLESAEATLYRDGWAARLAYSLGLQGPLQIDRAEFVVPARPWKEPLRVAFASDLHAGPLTDARLFHAVVAAFMDFSPHLVLLGGDYVSLHSRHISAFLQALRTVRPPLGILAVLGNHDLWLDDQAIVGALESAGVTVLINKHHHLPSPFHGVSVFGLDEPGTGSPNASLLPGESGMVQLVLMHSPLGVPLLQGKKWHIAFCGHTHGGQIALPGGVPVVLPRGSGLRRHARGRFRLTAHCGGELLVSRGVGMSDLPIRMFSPPEVHLCTLHSSSSHNVGRA